MAKGGLDKEALKKHQFWIVLGLFGVLWMVSFVMVKVNASTKMRDEWTKAKDSIDKALSNGPKTPAWQEPWKKHGQEFSSHKEVIWKQAWDQQKDMYTWPLGMPPAIQPKYIDDPFGPTLTADQNNRGTFRTDWYENQFEGGEELVTPVELQGGYETQLPKQQWDRRRVPTREEIWLAQEDFWVRREMLYIVFDALNNVRQFKELPRNEKEKPPEGFVDKRVYRNSNWELTLLFELREPGSTVWVISDKSTIKNINASQRTLLLAQPRSNKGLPFMLHQNTAKAGINISGEPVAFGATTTLGQKFSVSPVDARKPFYVEQVLDWEISPIRRIDALELAWHSHRTVTTPLKVHEKLKNLDPPPEDTTGAATTGEPGVGGPGGGAPAVGEGGPGGMGMGGMGMAQADVTPVNGIFRERYLYLTPQCRHLPVAMKLLVDQANIHDVLTAVANSKLRIQITQVTLHHDLSTGGQQPGMGGPGGVGGPGGPGGTGGPGGPGIVGATGGRGGPMPGGPPGGRTGMPGGGGRTGPRGLGGPGAEGGEGGMRGMMGGFGGGRPFMPTPGSRGGAPPRGEGPGGPGGFGGEGGPEMGMLFTDTAQLVELSIYGIASIYERFPPKPGSTDSTTPPAGETPPK